MDSLRPPSSSCSSCGQTLERSAEEERRRSRAEDEVDAPAGGGRRGGRLALGVKGKGLAGSKLKSVEDKDAASSASSSSASSSTTFGLSRKSLWQEGVRLRSRRRRAVSVPCSGDHGVEIPDDLALPLGMSFAAVVAQVLNKKNAARKRLSLNHLSTMCQGAVRESITNIYGDKFDLFIKNFEKSFVSTLMTLWKISETSTIEQENTAGSSFPSNVFETAPTKVGIADTIRHLEDNQDNVSFATSTNQLVPHGQVSWQLSQISHRRSGSEYSSLLNTFERSVIQQTRSNDLKEFEMFLGVKKLQMKHEQLSLHSETNTLEKEKIRMGYSKASFKEEKLKNERQEKKHADFLKSCIDILGTGLFIMCSLLFYAAYVFSYQRITDSISTCTSVKESKSWWIPKQVTFFNSVWLMLRCHVAALIQLAFGILTVAIIACLVFYRSAISNPSMPVTFIGLLLGIICGFFGKCFVDALGGRGYHWLMYWEIFCMLHFFANVFPSLFHHALYGPVILPREVKAVRLPYWIRRYTFFSILLLVLPTLTALLPFASVCEWKDHFSEKLSLWRSGS